MTDNKRFSKFTMRRSSFWLFFLAGPAAMSLVPLFENSLVTVVGTILAATLMAVTAAARLRDMGCSAWYTPLVAIPPVAVYAGLTAGDHRTDRPTFIEYRVLAASFVSFVFSFATALSLLN